MTRLDLPPRRSDAERNAKAALTKAANSGHAEHKMGDALVGIGWAVLHLASQINQKGAHHGDTD
jgi:hypothetical protein